MATQPYSTTEPYIQANSRADFIVRTYNHLIGAIFAFTGLEIYLFKSGMAETIARSMLSVNWLFILGGFMVIGWLASRAAHTAISKPAQYAALAAYVVAEALIFVPLLYVAATTIGISVIKSAAYVTIFSFIGLSAIVHVTKKDFSFLRGIVMWGMVIALVLIVAGVLFGFQLGVYFSVAMVALAGCAILYDTSNILHHYPRRPPRRGRLGTVRLCRAHVLVCLTTVYVEGLSKNLKAET